MWQAALGMLNLGQSWIADKQNRRLQKQAMAQAQDQFRAQMDESVQRRVRDAQQAGVHPLFALGASVGASPTTSTGMPGTTNYTGRAAASLINNLTQAQIAKTEAEASLAASKAAREQQLLASQSRDTLPEITDEMLPKRRAYLPESEKGMSQLYVDAYDRTTRRPVSLFNPEMGLDEIGQALAVGNITEGSVRSNWNRAINWYKSKVGGTTQEAIRWFERQFRRAPAPRSRNVRRKRK